MRFLKGNRTRIFATIVGVLGIAETYNPDIVRQLVPEQYQGMTLCLIAVGIFVLRQITTTPAGAKQ